MVQCLAFSKYLRQWHKNIVDLLLFHSSICWFFYLWSV